MIPLPPMSVELHDPNHAGLPWAVWVLRDGTGRPFMRGRDRAGLETVAVALNEWQVLRAALSTIAHLSDKPYWKIGVAYATARAIAKEALEGYDVWQPVESEK